MWSRNNYDHWASSSHYIDEYSYNLFVDIFKQYADDFNYYGSTLYFPKHLDQIHQAIKQRIRELNKQESLEDLIHYYQKNFFVLNISDELKRIHKASNSDTSLLIKQIQHLYSELIDLLNDCIAQNQPLWILGM
ncbi:MAG: hypothetical protein AAFP70_13125 [Calditrichota bacterium]